MKWVIRSLPVVVLLIAACGTQKQVVDNSVVATDATPGNCTTPSPCWMTAGGTKFVPGIEGGLAQRGPKVSFGGNVAPSCSLDPGQGGQWNHVDHDLKWHFQGFQIDTVSCDGVPTGSPSAEVNHILFSGRGRLLGIAGNKDSYENVCFTAEAWDWAEPGSKGQPVPDLVDQYTIHVTDCAGVDLLWLTQAADGGAGLVGDGPVRITGGNIQIHPCN